MESFSLEEEKITKNIKNLSRLEKANKSIKYRIFTDIKNFFEHEEDENYYKPIRVDNFWSNDHVKYQSNGDRNKTLSVEEYFNRIRPCLQDIINIAKNLPHGKFN